MQKKKILSKQLEREIRKTKEKVRKRYDFENLFFNKTYLSGYIHKNCKIIAQKFRELEISNTGSV